jgi:His/Glu/Gln/Arg/opine family amino acid ABC transporter permease subunit
VALLRLSRWRLLRYPAIAYIEFLRGTPALVQLFVIYFGLPDTGFQPTPLEAAIVGLGLNGAAYLAEIYRAGIEAIHKGQLEAALSLGMTPARAMRSIILPQAVRTMLPPITNFAIVLLKDTAVIYAIAVPEIMAYARNLVTETLQSAVVYLMAGAIYLCMTIPMARVAARLERARRAWQ